MIKYDVKFKLTINTSKLAGLLTLVLGSVASILLKQGDVFIATLTAITAIFANRDYQDRKNNAEQNSEN